MAQLKSIEIQAKTNVRADTLLRDSFGGPGKRLLKRLFEEKLVRTNGTLLKKGDTVLAGQTVTIESFDELSDVFAPVAVDAPLTIAYENKDFWVFNKEANMPCMPLKPGEIGTFANRLVHHYPSLRQIGLDPREAGLANRLDSGTSGLVLVAKHKDSWRELRKSFKQNLIKKEYIAICESKPTAESNHSPLLQKRELATQNEKGLAASTIILLVAPHGKFYKVVCSTNTGRMHQIRAHLAGLGAPLVGDPLYGSTSQTPIKRHALHASKLMIPTNTDNLVIESSMPKDMEDLSTC